MNASTSPHPDLPAAQARAYAPCGYIFTHLQPKLESADYAACTLQFNELRVQYRAAKITPTKVGQFVTLWNRVGRGLIQAFDLSDPVDMFVVSTRVGHNYQPPSAAHAGVAVALLCGHEPRAHIGLGAGESTAGPTGLAGAIFSAKFATSACIYCASSYKFVSK